MSGWNGKIGPQLFVLNTLTKSTQAWRLTTKLGYAGQHHVIAINQHTRVVVKKTHARVFLDSFFFAVRFVAKRHILQKNCLNRQMGTCCRRGDWKRGTGKLGTILQGVENARPLAMEHRSNKCSKTEGMLSCIVENTPAIYTPSY